MRCCARAWLLRLLRTAAHVRHKVEQWLFVAGAALTIRRRAKTNQVVNGKPGCIPFPATSRAFLHVVQAATGKQP